MVFLSHSSRDKRIAVGVKALLERHGIRVWYSDHSLVGADEWQREIGRAILRANWFVVILTRHTAKSTWAMREVAYALEEHRFKDRIVPLVAGRYDKGAFWTIRGLQYIELRQRTDATLRKLLRVWDKTYDGGGMSTRD